MKVTLKVDLSVAGGQQLEKNQVEFVYGSGAMLSGLEAVLQRLLSEKGTAMAAIIMVVVTVQAPSMPLATSTGRSRRLALVTAWPALPR